MAAKRKAGQAGSGGVANFTREKLPNKLANDRKAQRATCERTKNIIGVLRWRIRELERLQPSQALQRAQADRDRALGQCEQLRRRLAAIANIVGDGERGHRQDWTM